MIPITALVLAVVVLATPHLITPTASDHPAFDTTEPLTMDIRRVPASQHHGLALMADGEMIVAGDVWTLAVSLDMAGFRKTVRRLTTNAAVMRVLARNFTELARSSNQASPDTQEFADTIGALLDSEVAAVQDDLAIATKHLKSLEMATPASRPSPLPDSPAVPELLSRQRRAWIDIGGAALKTVFGVATQRDLSRLQARLGSLEVGKREIGHILETQASLLNASFHDQAVMGKQLDRLAATNKLLVNEVVSLRNQTTTLLDQQPAITILEARLRLIHAAMGRLRGELSRFLVGWEAAAQHTLSTTLLPPADFLFALREIQAKLAAGRTLIHPAEEDYLGAHYASCRVTTVKINDGVLLYVDLPVTHTGLTFRLLRAVPLPVATAEPGIYAHVVPDYPYLAVSLDQKLYVHLDDEDRRSCQESTVRLCNPQRPLRSAADTTSDCLLALYKGDSDAAQRTCVIALTKRPAPTLYRARGTTTWLFSLATAEVVTAHCTSDPASTPAPSRLSGVGTLTLPPGCSATIRGAQLSAPAHFSSAYAAGPRDEPFVMPRLPVATWANWTLPVVATSTPSLQARVEALLNTTTGTDPISSRTAVRLASLQDHIREFQRDDQEATAQIIHLATTTGMSSLVLVFLTAAVAYCCCCRGGLPLCPSAAPSAPWIPLQATAPFSPEPVRVVYTPAPPGPQRPDFAEPMMRLTARNACD